MGIETYNGHEYCIIDKPNWGLTKAFMKMKSKLLDNLQNPDYFFDNPEMIDWMLKNFITSPKLTDESLDVMDVDEIVFLIEKVSEVRLPEDFLSQIKKKRS